MRKAILAIIVGVATAVAVGLVAAVLKELDVKIPGEYLAGVAALLGLLAGVWFYFTDQTPLR